MQQNVDKIQDCTNCFEHIKVNYNNIAFVLGGCLHPCFKCNVQIKLRIEKHKLLNLRDERHLITRDSNLFPSLWKKYITLTVCSYFRDRVHFSSFREEKNIFSRIDEQSLHLSAV